MDIGDVRCPECSEPLNPETCRCGKCGTRITGEFTLSPLAKLCTTDQALVIAFLRSYGSIKKLQEALGVSYPTARSRIERIVQRLDELMQGPSKRNEILEQLDNGTISFDEAVERL